MQSTFALVKKEINRILKQDKKTVHQPIKLLQLLEECLN